MPELLLRHGIWLAVCDGQRALLLENDGDQAHPKLVTREAFDEDNPLTHVQGSAPPGRVFSGDGRRAATEERDFHQQKAEHFIDAFAEIINQRVAQGQVSILVLIAPSKALGRLRPRLSEQTRKIVVAELARDYSNMPLHEIERRLSPREASH